MITSEENVKMLFKSNNCHIKITLVGAQIIWTAKPLRKSWKLPFLAFRKKTVYSILKVLNIFFQIFVNPISGTIIDRIGYDLPMLFGLTSKHIVTFFLKITCFHCENYKLYCK
jgi:hypothetical protein